MDAELLNRLETQHREAEDLIAQLEDATEEAEQQPLVEKLLAAMAEHMEIEEQQVYPELEKLDGELAEEANVEHGLARDGLSTLESMIGQPGFGAAVAMVKGGISHHVEDEESEAFPKLREALGLSVPDGQSGPAGQSGPEGQTKEELYKQAQEAGVEGRSSMSKDELAEAVSEQADG